MPEMQPLPDNVSQSNPRSSRTKVHRVAVILVGALMLFAILTIVAASTARKRGRDYMVNGANQMIEASSLQPAEQQDATATVRIFVTKAVADEISEDRVGKVMREIMGGPYGKLLQMVILQRAIQKSEMDKEKKTAAQENAHILFAAYVEKLISDAELTAVIEAIPKDELGQPAKPPWKGEDLDRVLLQAGAVLHGREIKPKDGLPDFPDSIRQVVRAMKEAVAAAGPDAAHGKPRP
jgi:hypothetical protein